MKLALLSIALLLSLQSLSQPKCWDCPWEPGFNITLGYSGRDTSTNWLYMTPNYDIDITGYKVPKKSTHYSMFILQKHGEVVFEIMGNGDVYIDPAYFPTKPGGKNRLKKAFNIAVK